MLVITVYYGLKITPTCDMQSRTSPFPRSFLFTLPLSSGFDRNTNQVLSAASLLSDHRLMFWSPVCTANRTACTPLMCYLGEMVRFHYPGSAVGLI